MPPGATEAWLAVLEDEADQRGISVDTDVDGRIFHFHLGNDPGVVGKVRYSEQEARNYENEQGTKHIWHRYNRELERIEDESERKVVNITLDVPSKNDFDPDKHHFLFLTQEMLDRDTYSQDDQKIWIEGEGRYSGLLAEYVDDWDALFAYAVRDDPEVDRGYSSTSSDDSDAGDALPTGSAGTRRTSTQTAVDVSARFKRAAHDRYDHRCVLTGIEHSELLTVSHILDRASHPEIAEDLGNVVILDWTHHVAFDEGFWTFDESGRIWINPAIESESTYLDNSLIDRHGEKIELLGCVDSEYIERHNEELEWWPPR